MVKVPLVRQYPSIESNLSPWPFSLVRLGCFHIAKDRTNSLSDDVRHRHDEAQDSTEQKLLDHGMNLLVIRLSRPER